MPNSWTWKAIRQPLLRAQLHYHLGTSQLRTRQVMIEAQALARTHLPPTATSVR